MSSESATSIKQSSPTARVLQMMHESKDGNGNRGGFCIHYPNRANHKNLDSSLQCSSSVRLDILLLKTKWNLLLKLYHVTLRDIYTIKAPGKEGFSVLTAGITVIIERTTVIEKLSAPNLENVGFKECC